MNNFFILCFIACTIAFWFGYYRGRKAGRMVIFKALTSAILDGTIKVGARKKGE